MSPTSANNFWAIFIILKYKISANIISLPLVTAELTFGQVEEQATLWIFVANMDTPPII